MKVCISIIMLLAFLSHAGTKEEWRNLYDSYEKSEPASGLALETPSGVEIRFPSGKKVFLNDTTSLESWTNYKYVRRLKLLNSYLIAHSAGERTNYLIVGNKRTDTLLNFPVFNLKMDYAFIYGNDQLVNQDLNDLIIYKVKKSGLTKIKSYYDSLGIPWSAKWKGPMRIEVISEKRIGSSVYDTTTIEVNKVTGEN